MTAFGVTYKLYDGTHNKASPNVMKGTENRLSLKSRAAEEWNFGEAGFLVLSGKTR
jgi:hypothetical protein